MKLAIRISGSSAAKFGGLPTKERIRVKRDLLVQAARRLDRKVWNNLKVDSACLVPVDKDGHNHQTNVRNLSMDRLKISTSGTGAVPDSEPECYEYTVFEDKMCCIKCFSIADPQTGSSTVSTMSPEGAIFASVELFVEWSSDQGEFIDDVL